MCWCVSRGQNFLNFLFPTSPDARLCASHPSSVLYVLAAIYPLHLFAAFPLLSSPWPLSLSLSLSLSCMPFILYARTTRLLERANRGEGAAVYPPKSDDPQLEATPGYATFAPKKSMNL